jgi:hypothetical protein
MHLIVTDKHCEVFFRYAASQMPVDVGASQRTATIHAFFSVAVENPAVFHAFMAKTRCDYEAYLGKTSHTQPSPQVLYHRGKALKSLPNQLQSGKVEYGFVAAIILLMTVDVSSAAAIDLRQSAPQPCY